VSSTKTFKGGPRRPDRQDQMRPLETALQSLQTLGLTLYEARLYLGLLQRGSQNGNELSRTSGVPSSKVYSTLDRLVSAGIVHQVNKNGSAEYSCVSPPELVALLRDKYTQPLDFLQRTSIAGSVAAPEIVPLAGFDAIVSNALAVIRAAEKTCFISLWDENVAALGKEIVAAGKRGVQIFGMIYGDGDAPAVGQWQRHSYREVVAGRIRGHMVTLVADGREAVIAHMPERDEPAGIRTANPVLVLVAEEYLRHDQVLQKAKSMTGFEEWDRWLHSDEDVNAIVHASTLGRSRPKRARRAKAV
jgi:HTH-type transcriptional regulator, sugar sensing transcriptional regulator